MSRDPSSPALLSETDVLYISPPTAPGTCSTLPAPSPAILSTEVETDLSYTPLTASISKALLAIDALPSPPCSPAIVSTEPLVCASPLTERALRPQRRDALRATCDVAAASSPDTIRSNAILAEREIVPARMKKQILFNASFHPSTACSCIGLSYSCDHPSSNDARG